MATHIHVVLTDDLPNVVADQTPFGTRAIARPGPALPPAILRGRKRKRAPRGSSRARATAMTRSSDWKP